MNNQRDWINEHGRLSFASVHVLERSLKAHSSSTTVPFRERHEYFDLNCPGKIHSGRLDSQLQVMDDSHFLQ